MGLLQGVDTKTGQVHSPAENRRITLLHQDYLDHCPSVLYDGVTVVGMVEHVGLSGYPEFFEKCSQLLRPGARLVIHTIVDAEDGKKTASWLDAKIFPGGYMPSVTELTRGAQNHPLVLKNIFLHDSSNYRRTLQCWQDRLSKNEHEIKALYTDKHQYTGDELCPKVGDGVIRRRFEVA